jgi:hypothetical protein
MKESNAVTKDLYYLLPGIHCFVQHACPSNLVRVYKSEEYLYLHRDKCVADGNRN